MDFLLEDINLLEKFTLEMYSLEKDCLFENTNNNEKKFLYSILNGFEKDEEKKVKEYKDIIKKVNEYKLNKEWFCYDSDVDEYIRVTVSPYIYLYKGFPIEIRIAENIDETFKYIKSVCKEIDLFFEEGKKASSMILFAVPKRFEIATFQIFNSIFEEEDRIGWGRSLYLTSDYGASQLSLDMVKTLFEEEMKENEEKEGKIIIYRGMGSRSKDEYDGYSWTTNEEVAKFFATRFSALEDSLDDVRVVKLEIDRKHIVAELNTTEKEIIVDNELIQEFYYELIEEIEFDKTQNYTYH